MVPIQPALPVIVQFYQVIQIPDIALNQVALTHLFMPLTLLLVPALNPIV